MENQTWLERNIPSRYIYFILLRGLNVCDHFKAIFNSLWRRTLNKDIGKCLDFKAKPFGFVYFTVWPKLSYVKVEGRSDG